MGEEKQFARGVDGRPPRRGVIPRRTDLDAAVNESEVEVARATDQAAVGSSDGEGKTLTSARVGEHPIEPGVEIRPVAAGEGELPDARVGGSGSQRLAVRLGQRFESDDRV